MQPLPLEWRTPRLMIRDVMLADVPRLRDVFNACAYAEPWDPTFHSKQEEAFVELVSKSIHRNEVEDHLFQMQAIRSQDTHDIIGYFDLYHGHLYRHGHRQYLLLRPGDGRLLCLPERRMLRLRRRPER